MKKLNNSKNGNNHFSNSTERSDIKRQSEAVVVKRWFLAQPRQNRGGF